MASQEAFKANYNQHTFMLTGAFSEDSTKSAIEYRRTIHIDSIQMLEELAARFGHFIQIIEIDFEGINQDKSLQIMRIVNDYLSASLKMLQLHNCKGNILNGLYAVFPKMNTLKFSSSLTYNVKRQPNLQLIEVFPNLQKFYVDHTKQSDWEFFDCNLPYLLHLSVVLPQSKGEDEIDETQIMKFLKQNPQIVRLRIVHSNLKLLKEVSEKFKNKLNSLALAYPSQDHFNYEGDSIQFNGVRKFYFESDDVTPKNIVFDKLEELELVIKVFTDEWAQFIANNTNLNNFYLSADELSTEHFLSIPEKQSNLKRFRFIKTSLTSSLQFGAADILDFLKRSVYLENVYLVTNLNETEQNRLKKSLPENWQIEKQMQLGNKFLMILEG